MRRWLLVDTDPVRPSGISSTDEELEKAHQKSLGIWKFLKDEGFPEPVAALSGNGYHLLYRCEVLVSKESDETFKRFLQALAQQFDDDWVKVDQTVFNRARICKLYGTMAKKGSDTPERPWRESRIVYQPNEILLVDIENIRKVADKIFGDADEAPQKSESGGCWDGEKFDLQGWLDKHGIEYKEKTMTGGKKFILKECPFNHEHKAPDSTVFQSDDGKLGFKCLHNSCSQYSWHDFRLLHEPDAYDKKTPEPDEEQKERDTESEEEDNAQPLIDGVSQWLSTYMYDCASCYGMPRGMVDAIAMTVASSAIGNKFHVHDGSFDTNLSLWLVYVAPSGTGKTPLLGEVLRPVKDAQSTLFEAYRVAHSEWKMLPKKEREQQEEPFFQKLYVSDVTPESLYAELSRHHDGLLLMRDEIAGWVKDFGRYNDSGEVQNLLSIFSGQPITITRKTSDPVFVNNPFLSIVGGVQPLVVSKTFNQEGFVESGFVGRFLWCCPTCEIREEYEQREVDKTLRAEWSNLIAKLYSLPKAVLTLSSEALTVKSDFYRKIKRYQRKAEDDQDLFGCAMYGKAIEYADRVAGILHLISRADEAKSDGDAIPLVISGATYEKAVTAMEQFMRWGLKVRSLMEKTPQLTKKGAILNLHRILPIRNQSKFAEAVGVTPQYISKILKK